MRLSREIEILQAETERLQASGAPERRYRFPHELTDMNDRRYRSAEETPEGLIALFEDGVCDVYERCGLEVSRVDRGDWSRGTAGRSQDLLVARKR